MTTPGTPEKVKPDTRKGHAWLTWRHWRLTCDQMPGIDSARCGSFASSGLPVVVREPETTHEFDPMSSPCPKVEGAASRAATAASTAWAPSGLLRAVRTAGVVGTAREAGVAGEAAAAAAARAAGVAGRAGTEEAAWSAAEAS